MTSRSISWVERLFLSDKVILWCIVVNALLIFINGFEIDATWAFFLSLADHFITLLFVVEMVVKLRCYRSGYFASSWNIFDFVLVLCSLPTLCAFICGVEAREISFLLVFRVLRIFKTFRFIKFVPGIEQLLSGVMKAMKSSLIVALGFFVYIFLVGILSFYLFKDFSPDYYANPFISLYSTFKIFTLEGWSGITESVTASFSDGASVGIYLYFIFVVMSGGIFGLSLVNSIFVDAMLSDSNEEMEGKMDRLEGKMDRLEGKIDRLGGKMD